MKRWLLKRWTWAGVFGITAAVGLALGAGKEAPPSASAPPKVGDVIPLKFEKGPEKQVKILKSEKQADGSYQMEVKDLKSGEVFTLIDRTHIPPAPAKSNSKIANKTPEPIKAPETTKSVDIKNKTVDIKKTTDIKKPTDAKGMTTEFSAKAKSTFSDPLLPQIGATMPESSKDKERKAVASSKPITAAAPATMPESAAEPQKKPGLFRRMFGKDTTPPASAMPKTSTNTMAPSVPVPVAPAFPITNTKPIASAKPTTSTQPTPAFTPSTSVFDMGTPQPAPRTTATGTNGPRLFPDRTTKANEPPKSNGGQSYGGSALLPPPDRTPEPPRTLPMKPVAPPTPVIPVPVTPPTTPPTAAPTPLPIPSNPAPAIPAPIPSTPMPSTPALPTPVPVPSAPTPVIPAVPNGPGGLPTIPQLPGGMSMVRSGVTQASFASSVAMALAQDIQPHVTSLRTAVAPSMRVMAAKALSGGRHASTETVKSILFIACTTDPSPFVRACCIDELCKLGYFDAAFMEHLYKACGDSSEEVRTAAKDALKKMTPSR